jgi:hypothetical protein
MKDDKPTAKGTPDDKVTDTAKEKVGTHSLGATVGAVGGAVAGAIGGLAAGPVGSLAGAVGGAVLGGAAAAATGITQPQDTSEHEAYWRANYAGRKYVPAGADFSDYEPAYRYGTQAYVQSDRPRTWDEVEADLRSGWESAKGSSPLGWEQAHPAVRDAWERMHNPADRVNRDADPDVDGGDVDDDEI